MQVDLQPYECHICPKLTVSSLSEKKRLVLSGNSAETVREIIKSIELENLLIPNFSFIEPLFRAGDYICFTCITLLNTYDKAKKRLEELKQHC